MDLCKGYARYLILVAAALSCNAEPGEPSGVYRKGTVGRDFSRKAGCPLWIAADVAQAQGCSKC